MPTEVKSQIGPAMCGRTETGGSKIKWISQKGHSISQLKLPCDIYQVRALKSIN